MSVSNGYPLLFGFLCACACSGGTDAQSPMSTGGAPGAGAGASGAGPGSAGAGGGLPSSVKCDEPWPSNAPTLKEDSWTAINPPALKFTGEPQSGPFTQGMAIDPCNTSTLYLCIDSFNYQTDGGGVYKSIDAGATWKRVGQLEEPLRVRVDPKNPNHLFAVDGVRGGTQGFWISQDGGNNWTKPDEYKALMPSVFTIDDLYDIAVDPADFGHALITFHSPWATATAGQNSGVLETTDGGTTWIPHQPQPTWGAGNNVWFLSNSSTWLVGTQADGFWRTADAGKTWKQVSKTQMTHGGGQLYKSKTGALYSACVAGIQRSTDDGVTWTTVGSIKPTSGVWGDGNRIYTHSAYGSGEDTFFFSPESDGITWSPLGTQKFTDGPFEMALDGEQGIMYSANWGNGLLAMKVTPAK